MLYRHGRGEICGKNVGGSVGFILSIPAALMWWVDIPLIDSRGLIAIRQNYRNIESGTYADMTDRNTDEFDKEENK